MTSSIQSQNPLEVLDAHISQAGNLQPVFYILCFAVQLLNVWSFHLHLILSQGSTLLSFCFRHWKELPLGSTLTQTYKWEASSKSYLLSHMHTHSTKLHLLPQIHTHFRGYFFCISSLPFTYFLVPSFNFFLCIIYCH